ncbi:MAG: alpha/beta fold hydrolase [Comamonas sp.]
MPFITLSHPTAQGGSLYYEDQGQGRPVVLIHGWPLSGKSWEAQVGPLVDAGFRVITYDRRGFGASCRPWEGYNYDVMAQDLDDLLQALDLKDVTLVGFSMGGGEVARYIGKYGSQRVAQAVFAAAVPPYLFKTEDNPEGAVTQKDVDEKQAGVKQDRQAFLEAFTQKFFTPKGGKLAVSEDQRLFAKAIASTASPKGTHDCVEAFSCTDFRGDLAKFQIPTLVLHGDSDQTVPMAVSGQRTHSMVKGSSLHVIKGGPHGCNVSHAQEFNQALITFLSQ